MTTIETSPDTVVATRADAGPSRIAGLAAWLVTSDHKRVGRLFVGGSVLGLLAAIVTSIVLGVERIDGDDVLLDAGALPQLFQAQRIGFIFGAMLPLGLGLAVAVVPLQLGARALAFPRLALAGFYTWLGGLVMVAVSLAADGGIGGSDDQMVSLFLVGNIVMALGLLAAAVAVGTSVLTTRAPGMTLQRVPFFAWSALITALGLLLVLPVMIGTTLYLAVDFEHAQETFGGAAGIGTWIGWVFTQPVTYLFAIPAIGFAAEQFPVTFRTRSVLRGSTLGGIALVGVAALAGVTQQLLFEVPWSGEGLNFDDLGPKIDAFLPYAMFCLLPILGALAVLGAGAATAKNGRPRVTSPFLFGFFGLGMVLIGMLGGALLPIDDLGLQGTVFEEASLVFVVYGLVLGALGGLTYWAPKLWGRRIAEAKVLPLAALGMIAAVLAGFPYFIAGFGDQPAASPTYDYGGPAELWNVLVLVGHALMALTVVGWVGLAVTTFTGRRDDTNDDPGDDPWDANTIEWTTTSPAPGNNFVEVPVVRSPEPLLDRKRHAARTAATASDSTTGVQP